MSAANRIPELFSRISAPDRWFIGGYRFAGPAVKWRGNESTPPVSGSASPRKTIRNRTLTVLLAALRTKLAGQTVGKKCKELRMPSRIEVHYEIELRDAIVPRN